MNNNNNPQVKSRERVASHGEVFTAQREVNSMCNLVDNECRRFDSTFLEPACGNGNFLAEILSRKLSALHPNDQRKALIALSSLYCIDILPDNVNSCRQRLYSLWDSPARSDTARTRAREILNANIVCGDALKPETITFTEWLFPQDSITPRTKSFTLEKEVTRQGEFDFTE